MVKVPEESCLLLTHLGLHAIHTAQTTLDTRVGWDHRNTLEARLAPAHFGAHENRGGWP